MRTFCFSYRGCRLASGCAAAKITGRRLAARSTFAMPSRAAPAWGREGTTTRCRGLSQQSSWVSRCVWPLGRGFLSCACILLRRTHIRASVPAYSGFDGYISRARLPVSSGVKATSSLTHSVSVSLGGQKNGNGPEIISRVHGGVSE